MPDNASTALLDTMFLEAVRLTREAQHYIAGTARGDRNNMPPPARLAMASEITRLTRRMTVTVVWLRLQRSVHSGDMSHEELCTRFPPLAENLLCLEDCSGDESLPQRLVNLLKRSLNIYLRVSRLDQRMRDDPCPSVAPTAGHIPAPFVCPPPKGLPSQHPSVR